MDKTTWLHDAATGLMTNKVHADGHGPTYTKDGKLHTRTWARGIVTTYGYAPGTRELLTTDYSDDTPSVTNTLHRTWDSKGRTTGYRTTRYDHDHWLDQDSRDNFGGPQNTVAVAGMSLSSPPPQLLAPWPSTPCGIRPCLTECAKKPSSKKTCETTCRAARLEFATWAVNNRDVSWTLPLPPCPCALKLSTCRVYESEPGGTGVPLGWETVALRPSRQWDRPTSSLFGYHRGATWCMRSKPVGGHANQCCYDKGGRLMTHGSGSGSADRVPASILSFPGHFSQDVKPADLAIFLDGGKWGCWSERYLLVRPQHMGTNPCGKNP